MNAPKNNDGRRRRRRPQKARSSAERADQRDGGQKSPRQNRRRRRRSGGPKLSALDRLIVKVENLRNAHLEARRKYFELFDRADPRQKDKLERQFTQTMQQLRDFETALNEQDRELFKQHYDAYPLDLTYAQNHELAPEGENISFSGEFDDPHALESQKAANFKNDTEESVGTLDDYKQYKGIVE